jgi:hypothetical protein
MVRVIITSLKNFILVEQKEALISFLNRIESLGPHNELSQAFAALLPDPPALLDEIRREIPYFSDSSNHKLSKKILASIEKDSFEELCGVLQDALATGSPKNQSRTVESPTEDALGLQTRLHGTNALAAFEWKYDNNHALSAFREYLDIQWSEINQKWVKGKSTSQSRCGTIVQSSCTGKSRLVEEYASRMDAEAEE